MNKNSSNYLGQEICFLAYVETKNVSIAKGHDKYHVALSFLNGAILEMLYFTPGTADYNEVEKEFAAGNLYQQSGSCSIPGYHPANGEFYNVASNLRVIMVIGFQNGESLVCGTVENPVLITSKFNQAKKAHLIEFNRTGSKALWLE